MLKKYYLGGFFWAPIPVKQYQNTSGFAASESDMNTFYKCKLNVQVAVRLFSLIFNAGISHMTY